MYYKTIHRNVNLKYEFECVCVHVYVCSNMDYLDYLLDCSPTSLTLETNGLYESISYKVRTRWLESPTSFLYLLADD